jgi:hypothetical protein
MLTRLVLTRGNTDYYYICKIAKFNFYLGRYYPHAELIMVVRRLE